eukprot:gene19151-21072_t
MAQPLPQQANPQVGNSLAKAVRKMEHKHLIPKFSSFNVITVVSYAASAAMIFGGVVPYIPQYIDIYKSKNIDGFSTYVCLALLLANILRILFWFGHPFEFPLLAQSVIMIFAMLVLLELCIRIKREGDINLRKRYLWNLDMASFWNWTNFRDYVQFILIFITMGGWVTYSLLEVPVYLETLGFISVFTEAMLGSPQFYRNYRNKSTDGMSIKMVVMWMCGDTFKTGYFIVKDAPVQFWVCGSLQVSIDLAILYQVFHYRRRGFGKQHTGQD